MTHAAWAFGLMLLAQHVAIATTTQTTDAPTVSEQQRLELARQRAAMLHALRQIQALEIEHFGGAGGEGLHAHEILVLADRALGTKHRCHVPKEWLER